MNEQFEPRRVLSYLFIVGIALLFALQWGPGAKGCDTPLSRQTTAAAATVNGQEVPLQEFQRAYAAQLSYMRSQGSPITEALAQQVGIPQQVLDQLVHTELLAQAAEKQGLAASDDELLELIQKNADFKKAGHFDFERYREVLRDYYRQTDVDYESELRRRLNAQKLMQFVESTAVVSNEEVKAKFLKEGNRAKVEFVRFSPSQYAAKVPTPKAAELSAFQAAQQKEIADDYAANRALYEKPERVKARHILIKVDKDAPEAEAAKTEARTRIEALKKELDAGKDFAELARSFSEDPGSKANGGDLGLNERSAWVPAFADAAFSLKPGEVSAPVETPFGWHLIKVDEKKAPEKRELAEVQGEIAKQLYTKSKAKELAEKEARKALEALKGGKTLAELAELKGSPELQESGEFNSTAESVPKLGPSAELFADVFAAHSPGLLTRVYAVGDSFAVVTVDERKLPTDQAFEAEIETLRSEVLRGKQFELRDAYLKSLKKQAQVVYGEGVAGARAPLDRG